jgi:hypothetical protein
MSIKSHIFAIGAASEKVRSTIAEFGRPWTRLPRMTRKSPTPSLRYELACPPKINPVTKPRVCLRTSRHTSVAKVALTAIQARSGPGRHRAHSLPCGLIVQGHREDHLGARCKVRATGEVHVISASGRPRFPMFSHTFAMRQSPPMTRLRWPKRSLRMSSC